MSTDFRTEKIAQGDKTMTEKTANKTNMSKKTADERMRTMAGDPQGSRAPY